MAAVGTGRVNPGSDSSVPDTVDAVVDTLLASSRALVAISARSIAGVRGITLPQFRMLVVLDEVGRTNLSRLAAELDVAASTAMRMVDRLESSGQVERTVEPQDRRTTWLTLTTAGRRTVRTVTNRRRRDLAAAVERVPPRQRAELTRAMAAFATAAEDAFGSAVTRP